MKHFLLSVSLLFSILGCSKFEGEYAINCEFPPNYFANRILVVTNTAGKTIGAFDIPVGTSSLSVRLKTSDENASDIYALHLIDTSFCTTSVASHFDIPNGALVYLNPYPQGTILSDFVFIQIHDIESFDSLEWVSLFKPQLVSYKADQKRIDAAFYVESGQGLLLRLQANGASEFRHLYLPDSVRLDTAIRWQDFKPETAPRIMELPGGGLVSSLIVNAVSTDFNHYVTLREIYGSQNGNVPFAPEFKHPDGWAEPAAYQVRVEQGNSTFEKIFQPGEALRFEQADFTIDEITLGLHVAVRATGDIDLLHAYLYRSNTQPDSCGLLWVIDGSVGTFEHIEIPDLGEYLPDGVRTGPFQHGTVYAYQFGKQNYPQVREGFPFKSNERFALARSGFVSVSKFK